MSNYKDIHGSSIQNVEGNPANTIRGQFWYDSIASEFKYQDQVTDASGNITASSDSSLKTRVYEKISGLDEVLELQPKAYYWNKDEKKNIEFGFFADEVKDIIPEAAPLHKDGTYGLLDRGIIAALVNSIQELKAEIEELKNKPCICDKCNCK